MALSRIYDISKRSLSVYQKAMDVSAHNIANAGNADYSRQKVVVSSGVPQTVGKFQWGNGIQIATLNRVEDNLLTNQILLNTQKYKNYQKQSEMLSQIEVVFGEPTEYGLANYLNKYFDSFSSLSAAPNSMEARKEVIYAAQNLSMKVKDIYQSIGNVKSNLVNTLEQKTNELNEKLHELKEINIKIYEAGSLGVEANDLKDNRDKLLKDLSEIANIKTQIDNNGVVTVYVGGVFAVNMDAVTEFRVDNKNNGKLELRTKDGGVKAILSQGEMAGIVDTYNNKIDDYLDRIDLMMNVLVEATNEIHKKGYTIDRVPKTGINFFNGYENGNLRINEQLINDPTKIAVSSDGTAGNGDYAIELADLKTKEMFEGKNIMEYYGNIVNDIGNTVNSAKSLADSTELVLQQLENQKDSITAVSIDEEMTNILKYQKSFNASAKLVKMANDMMDELLNMV